jgi:hypothetical protein
LSSCSWVLWGEKVPAAVGTVANRLVVGDLLSAVEAEGAVLASHQAQASAGRTGLLLPEGVGLLFEEGGEGALGEAGRGRGGELFQGGEGGVEPGPLLAEGPTGDDFAPLGGQITDFLEVLGGGLGACHRLSCLEVTENGKTACLSCYKAERSAGQSVS